MKYPLRDTVEGRGLTGMDVGTGMRRTAMVAAAAILVSAVALVSAPAQALSPVPFFRGVERLAVFCGRPDAAPRWAALCRLAEALLEDLSGTDVIVGTAALSDPAAITVIVNGYEVDGPHGRLMVIEVRMLRRDHVDGRLFGAAPVVVRADAPLTESSEVADSLGALLSETVIGPWRLATPSVRPAATDDEKG